MENTKNNDKTMNSLIVYSWFYYFNALPHQAAEREMIWKKEL